MNNEEQTAQIKTIQALGSIAIIAPPVSLIFGGVLLSLTALICAILGRGKLKTLMATSTDLDAGIASMLMRQNTVGLVVSIIVLVVNIVVFAFAFSTMMQAMQSGDYSQMTQLLGIEPLSVDGAGAPDMPQDVSVWDK